MSHPRAGLPAPETAGNETKAFRVPIARYFRFKALCAAQGTSVTAALNSYIVSVLQESGYTPEGDPMPAKTPRELVRHASEN